MLTATSVSAAPSNQGFESGLTGWTAIGAGTTTPSTNVVTFNSVNWQINAFQTQMGYVNSQGQTVAGIEAALGLAAGALQPGNANPSGGNLTNGGAVYQDFAGTAGQTISQWFNYVARDYIPYNDPSYAVVINMNTGAAETIDVLASIQGQGVAVGTAGNTGWQLWTHQLGATATYRLAFISTNDKDQILDAALFLDNAAGTCVPNCPPVGVPVPASVTLLGGGLLGLAAVLRRRRRDAA